MSLGRSDGSYVNAPYKGEAPAIPSKESVEDAVEAAEAAIKGGNVEDAEAAIEAAELAIEAREQAGSSEKKGRSGGVTALLTILGMVGCGALVYLAFHNRDRLLDMADHLPEIRMPKRFRRNGSASRGWNDAGGDDFEYDLRQQERALGGRQATSRGSLRIVRGGDDDDRDEWDDGEGIASSWGLGATGTRSGGSKSKGSKGGYPWSSWGKTSSGAAPGPGDDDAGSVQSSDSYNSRGSYRSKSEENSDFLSNLRKEADATMKNMVKDDDANDDATTEDPRVDGGASIKSLLTHYREVKKGGLFDENEDGGGSVGGGGKKAGSPPRRKPPPPPPPRRKKNAGDGGAGATTGPDGLSDFTIV